MLVRSRKFALIVGGLALLAPGLQACTSTGSGGGTSGSPPQQAVIVTPVTDPTPGASLVAEQQVSLYAPLPAADGSVPAACERVSYLRWYDPSGPSNSANADAIFVAQPGIFEAAGAFDQVARNTVRAAAALGYHVEFWGINPRSTCLEDTTGVQAAAAAANPQLALDYYYNGGTVDGQKFGGFVSEQDAAWMAHMGLAQTVQDEYTIISQLPPAVRQSKVFCGGHSLGGIVTAAFANWDFSGTGAAADAGYNQCAGYFALDTRLAFSASSALLAQPFGTALNSILSLAGSSSPYIDTAPFTPETFTALPILGMAAYDQPNQLSTIAKDLPNDANFNVTFDLMLADSTADFATNTPNARAVNFTNQAALGELFSNIGEPIGIMRAGIGIPTGGPVVEKNFPVAYCSPSELGGLVGGQCQVSPDPTSATPSGPTYSWLNYNQLPATLPSPVSDPGHPYTSPAEQVSDINQLAWAMYGASPSLFTVDYFPTQLVLDIAAAGLGSRAGTLSGLAYSDGITKHPAAYIDAGDGVTPTLGTTGAGAIPAGPAPQVHVVVPGYSHLDVVTAAWAQNNGQPEEVSSTLAHWMSQVVGAPAA